MPRELRPIINGMREYRPTPRIKQQRPESAKGHRKRLEAVGIFYDTWVLPADFALARKHLTKEQHAAARHYRTLWGEMGPEYQRARSFILGTFGRLTMHWLEDLVVHERWSLWITSYKGDRKRLPRTQKIVMKSVQDALSSLAKFFDKNAKGLKRQVFLAERE